MHVLLARYLQSDLGVMIEPGELIHFAAFHGEEPDKHSCYALYVLCFTISMGQWQFLHQINCPSAMGASQEDTFTFTYRWAGYLTPTVKCHSMRSISSSWALLRDVFFQVSTAASWACQCMFSRIYNFKITLARGMNVAVIFPVCPNVDFLMILLHRLSMSFSVPLAVNSEIKILFPVIMNSTIC